MQLENNNTQEELTMSQETIVHQLLQPSITIPTPMDQGMPRTITPAQLRAARAFMDWSRDDCGQNLGISPETIKNIECRHFTPSKSTVGKIVRGFLIYGITFGSQWNNESVLLTHLPKKI
jgi:DNA-binding XRE family transcriptional regulator